MAAKQKNPAAVALGRKGGKKGGFARAAKLTAQQRSDSARKAVQARWAKEKGGDYIVEGAKMGINKSHRAMNEATPASINTSDNALLALLKRIKATNDPTKLKQLTNQLERMIFHKQYKQEKQFRTA